MTKSKAKTVKIPAVILPSTKAVEVIVMELKAAELPAIAAVADLTILTET